MRADGAVFLPAAIVFGFPLYLCQCPGTKQMSALPPFPPPVYKVGSWKFPDPELSALLPTSNFVCKAGGGGEISGSRKGVEISAFPRPSAYKVGSDAEISGQGKQCSLINISAGKTSTKFITFVSNSRAISTENKGHRMLSKMGWKEGEGLGKTQPGITEPVSSCQITPLKLTCFIHKLPFIGIDRTWCFRRGTLPVTRGQSAWRTVVFKVQIEMF